MLTIDEQFKLLTRTLRIVPKYVAVNLTDHQVELDLDGLLTMLQPGQRLIINWPRESSPRELRVRREGFIFSGPLGVQ